MASDFHVAVHPASCVTNSNPHIRRAIGRFQSSFCKNVLGVSGAWDVSACSFGRAMHR